MDTIDTSDWTDAEELLYYKLRDMYAAYRTGAITKQRGEQLKHDILAHYEQTLSDRRLKDSLIAHQGKLWQKIESAGTQYALCENHTEQADAFYEAVYGARPLLRSEQERDGARPMNRAERDRDGA